MSNPATRPHTGPCALCVPTYAQAILTDSPAYGLTFTTSDGVDMEWVTDMGTGLSGYCEVSA